MSEVVWSGNQPAQTEFLQDMMPGWSLYQGGFGAGKTWSGARKLLALHAVNGEAKGAVLAPTYGDLFRVVVPELLNAAREANLRAKLWAAGHGDHRYAHIDVLGRPIIICSADEPDRIAGWEAGHLWVDEGARIQTSAENPRRDAPVQMRARLRDKTARTLHGLVTTTPEGEETWVQRDWFKDPKDGHRHYIGSTRSNRALDPWYYEQLVSSIGKELLEQYLEGKAVNYIADRAHATFSEAFHVKHEPRDANLPAWVGMDFNVSPMCWALIQIKNNRLCVVDELVIEDNATVDRAIYTADDKGWGNFPMVNMCPDRSSRARSTTGPSEGRALRKAVDRFGWNVRWHTSGSNPNINASIDHLSTLIMAANGLVRVSVDPSCEWVINDFLKTSRGSNGYDPGKKGKRGHMLDAVRYVAWDALRARNDVHGADF